MILIFFLSINIISANEINDNNLNSIDSSNLNGIDSVDNTNQMSSDLTGALIEENSQSYDGNSQAYDENLDNSETNSEDSTLIGDSETNSEGNTLIDNSETNSEDNTGTLTENDEDESLELTKEKTSITIYNSTILCGNYLYLYLKDSNGNRLVDKNITLTLDNKNYTLTTNQNGIVLLKTSPFLGNYTLKAHFKGDSNYRANTSFFEINVYKIRNNITVYSESVLRGKYLYAYLKDHSGKAISGKKLTITLDGKTYNRTTNANGRVALTVLPVAGKYHTAIHFIGESYYYDNNKTFTLHVLKTATEISVLNTSVIRGKYLYAYLKTTQGVALHSKSIRIKFNNQIYKKTTNKYGRIALYVNKPAGTYETKIIFDGDGYYRNCSKSFDLKSYIESTKIVVQNATVVRGKYLYAQLKDSSNNLLVNEELEITFGSSKYIRTTNKYGRIGLLITAHPNNVSTKIHYSGSNSYKACSKSFTVNVLTNATAKIIAKSGSCLGEYSIRLTDMNGKPLVNQTLKIVASSFNHTAGSGKKITQKTIIIDSDNIFNKTADKKYMNQLATALRAKGYTVIVSEIGPNAHCNDVMGKYSNAVVLCLFGGADSGMFVDMSAKWYQNLLTKYNNRVVLGFVVPPNYVDLATISWLKRAHDDDYSPDDFTGLAYPGTYLNQHGMDYIYGRSATEMSNNFVNYAVKGLSIGLNNTLPKMVKSYSLKTNENGYVTLSDLPTGTYSIKISYSNTALGYVADTVTRKVEIL